MSYVKALVIDFNQEKALVGAFFVITTNLRMELFESLVYIVPESDNLLDQEQSDLFVHSCLGVDAGT